jgi:ketosteroid isomerase-like protein
MSEDPESLEQVARQVRVALESGDLSAFSELLDPDVRWRAPDYPSPACQNRDQVLTWYRRAKESGVSAVVSEVVVLGDRILVGLVVSGTEETSERGARRCDGRCSRCAKGESSTSSGSISEARLPPAPW